MEKSKVYFCDLYSNAENKNLLNSVKKLFDKAGFDSFIDKDDLVAIKLHFGEKGNTTYMNPLAVRQVVDKVKDCGAKPFLTDTNTLYTGSRTNSIDHITTAIQNGFAYPVVDAPIIIADGIFSRNYENVKIGQKHFYDVKIGGEIYNSSSMIVMSHFKGHGMAGFGGVLKNLAMGCASAAGKQMQHSDVTPTVKDAKCVGCGKCVANCPREAIKIIDKKANIDHDLCYGCGECPTICPTRAINVQWESDENVFIEKMAEFAYGAVSNKKGKVGYISFIMNVTPLCDCVAWSGRPIANDIGIVASTDPIAIEQACYDLVVEEMGHDVFEHAHPNINATRIIDYAYEMGMGNKEYELIKI